MTQWYSHLPMQETQIQPLSGEDPLEKEMTTHSSILAMEIHGQRNQEGYNLWGSQRVRHDLMTEQQQQLYSSLFSQELQSNTVLRALLIMGFSSFASESWQYSWPCVNSRNCSLWYFYSRLVTSDSSATLWTVAHQIPLFMGLFRQEHWSGLPLPPPRKSSRLRY